jgi:hypothetical protein
MTDVLPNSDFVEGDERIIAKAVLDAAEEKLRGLCASHAGTFVSVERRGAALEDSLTELLQKLTSVQAKVATTKQLLEQEEDSDKSLASLSEKHRIRRRTLLQHSSLLELLELPSLMDACVRSSLYDEALSITAFANTLERRHTEKNQVVLNVIAQVRSRQGDLKRHLLQCLKSPVTMPECLEVITALRRLNSIDLERQSQTNLERVHGAMEMALQVDFLEARDAWLDQAQKVGHLAGIGKNQSGDGDLDSSEKILDIVERYRTRYIKRLIHAFRMVLHSPFFISRLFEVATQFNAIFRTQTHSQNSVALLSMWVSRRVLMFLDVLRKEISVMHDAASLRDVLDATIFLAVSLGRLGADFSALLPPLFEDKIHSTVVGVWENGARQLSQTLRSCREAGLSSPLSSASVVYDESGCDSEKVKAEDNGPMPPPRQLMALPALGRFVNAILAGLNELRRCLLPGIFTRLRTSLDQVLGDVEDVLESNERALMMPGIAGETLELLGKAKEMRQVYAEILVPYVRGAMEQSLGNTATSMEYHTALVSSIRGSGTGPTEAEEDHVE